MLEVWEEAREGEEVPMSPALFSAISAALLSLATVGLVFATVGLIEKVFSEETRF